MDLLPTPAQLEVVALAADFLANELPIATIRQRRDEPAAVPASTWSACAELGLFGLGLPEQLGGAGFGLVEEALLFRELGRRVAPGPFLSTVLGARVAALAGSDKVANAVLAGETAVALAQRRHDAVTEPAASSASAGSAASAASSASAGSNGSNGSNGSAGSSGSAGLTGRFDLIDGPGADYALVVTRAGAGLVETRGLAEAVVLPCIDPGVRLATTQADDVPFVAWLPAGDDRTFQRGLVLATAVSVGIAEATRDMAAEYAKIRVQFGRPIGVNQAIKHACADMAVRAEAAASQLFFAAVCVSTDRADAEFQALSAKIVGDAAAVANSAANIQVHGGMGYTYEHDANLYLKRAHVLEHAFGERTDHLANLLAQPAAQ